MAWLMVDFTSLAKRANESQAVAESTAWEVRANPCRRRPDRVTLTENDIFNLY